MNLTHSATDEHEVFAMILVMQVQIGIYSQGPCAFFSFFLFLSLFFFLSLFLPSFFFLLFYFVPFLFFSVLSVFLPFSFFWGGLHRTYTRDHLGLRQTTLVLTNRQSAFTLVCPTSHKRDTRRPQTTSPRAHGRGSEAMRVF